MTSDWIECEDWKCGIISDKIFQFYSANRIYSIRNSTFTHIPFSFGFCNLSGIVLADICRYNEWCTER